MPLTLAEYKALAIDDVQRGVIDEFMKSSWFLDNLIFDNMAYPTGDGSAWTYGYNRVTTQATAAVREIHNEYSAQEAKSTRYTVDLKILGGKFSIDRAMVNTGFIENQLAFQLRQKTKAATALFNQLVIVGDDSNAGEFDGLDVALTGSSTEYNAGLAAIDLNTSSDIDSNYKAFLDKLDDWLGYLDGIPTALLMNQRMLAVMRAVARRSSAYTLTLDEFGRQIERYNGIPLIDLKERPGSTSPIVPIVTRTIASVSTSGLTDIYAVRVGVDGFHAISPSTGSVINTYLPDLMQPGAVKYGEVEMITSVALKATKAAGVFRNIQVS